MKGITGQENNRIRGQKVKKSKNIFIFLSLHLFVFLFICLSFYLFTFLPDVSADFRKSVGTSGAQFLKLGVNARAIAMGEAYSAVTDGADAIYWNPAGLYRIENKSFSLMHAVYLQNIYFDFASYAQRIGNAGTFALGVQYLNAGSIDQTDELGTNVGAFKPSDLSISVGWAKKFHEIGNDNIDSIIGITGKFIRSRIIETADAGAVDLGVNWNLFEKWWLSFGIQNLGSAIKFKEESDTLPVNVRLGSSYQVFRPFLVALDMNIPRDNNVNVGIGTEYKAMISQEGWFAARCGYNSRTTSDISKEISSVSAGAGLGWKGYSIDLAWVPFGQLGSAYRISLSSKF
ncbi:MAG: PorV/PorQ family protein [Elusimicrobia bacterium]|nr:PorV/PorQ family protein [Candidatus Obscuribacterium magneticum]